MYYKFKCPKCKNKQLVHMPFVEYTATGHHCDKCNAELVRDIKPAVNNTNRKVN